MLSTVAEIIRDLLIFVGVITALLIASPRDTPNNSSRSLRSGRFIRPSNPNGVAQ